MTSPSPFPSNVSGEIWVSRFRAFFERPVSIQALRILHTGSCVELIILTEEGGREGFVFLLENGSAKLVNHQPTDWRSQATLTLSPALAERILLHPNEDLADFALIALEAFFGTPRELQVQLHAGMIELWRRGWVRLVLHGGARVTTFLASHGFHGIGGIQRAIQALKSEKRSP